MLVQTMNLEGTKVTSNRKAESELGVSLDPVPESAGTTAEVITNYHDGSDGLKVCESKAVEGRCETTPSEQLISLARAARLVPRRRGDKPTNPATLYRWAQKGLKGARLEVIQAGGVLCTSKEAIARFFQQLTQQRFQDVPRIKVDRAHQIQAANRQAMEILSCSSSARVSA